MVDELHAFGIGVDDSKVHPDPFLAFPVEIMEIDINIQILFL